MTPRIFECLSAADTLLRQIVAMETQGRMLVASFVAPLLLPLNQFTENTLRRTDQLLSLTD